MADVRKTYREGQGFEPSASQFNRWQSTSDWVDVQRNTRGGGTVDGKSSTPTTILVQNTTPAIIKAGSVVGLDDLIFIPTDDKPVPSVAFRSLAPTNSHAAHRQLAILAEPANPGTGLYSAYVAGDFPARVDNGSGAGDFAAIDPGNSDSLVRAGEGEYQIIWIASGTGVVWAIVTPTAGGTLPTGQYKDQYFKMVSQNQNGWAPITARAM